MEMTQFEGRGHPPTDYAILALIEGQPGAGWRVLQLTLQRSLFIAPGLYFAGIRRKGLLISSLSASVSITACLLLWYQMSQKD